MPLFFDFFLVVLEKSLHTIYVLQNNRELAITSATQCYLKADWELQYNIREKRGN